MAKRVSSCARGVEHHRRDTPRTALLLGRDVLDTQVFDIAGKRLARVGDVRLEEDQGTLRAVGVEVGVGAVMRRLGLLALRGAGTRIPSPGRTCIWHPPAGMR